MDICSRKAYPSDLTDAQWVLLEPLLLAFENRVRPGPEREVDLREVLNTLLYQNRTGCQWAYLPHDLVAKSTAYGNRSRAELDIEILIIQVNGAVIILPPPRRFVVHPMYEVGPCIRTFPQSSPATPGLDNGTDLPLFLCHLNGLSPSSSRTRPAPCHVPGATCPLACPRALPPARTRSPLVTLRRPPGPTVFPLANGYLGAKLGRGPPDQY